MNITKKIVKNLTHKDIYEYELSNDKNLCCTISNYGSTLLSLYLKTSKGELRNIALGFEDFSTYINNSLYVGATLGPNAGRLANGNLPISDSIYNLSQNDNKNNLHGGFNNVSFKIWNHEKITIADDYISLSFSLDLPHGVDGYPGNRKLSTTFTLNNENKFSIHYEAESDMDTYINLSNHSYFNLSGDLGTSVLAHRLTISASKYLENNEEHVAEKLSSVHDSPFDFITGRTLESQISNYKSHPQLILGKGYNNGFILENTENMDKPALILESPDETITLSLYTNAPSIVLYSGGYIEEGLKLTDGSMSTPSCGLAIEPQDFPNGPNLDFINSSILKKGEIFKRDIIYKLGF